MPSERTPQQEIDFCHNVMMTWRKYTEAVFDAGKYEGTSRETPARMEASKQKQKLISLGQWIGGRR